MVHAKRETMVQRTESGSIVRIVIQSDRMYPPRHCLIVSAHSGGLGSHLATCSITMLRTEGTRSTSNRNLLLSSREARRRIQIQSLCEESFYEEASRYKPGDCSQIASEKYQSFTKKQD